MIRINLLGVERQKSKAASAFTLASAAPYLGGLVFVAAVGGVGWWYWSLTQTAQRLEADLVAKRAEADRLKTVTAEVQEFEARRKRLQDRVSLIEKLRMGQSLPVQLLDHVSRSLPEMLWLTDLEQEKGAVTIEGRTTTLIGLSDFVGNLAGTEVFEKPVEIVKSEVQTTTAPGQSGPPSTDLIAFTVRARVAGTPGEDADPAKPAR